MIQVLHTPVLIPEIGMLVSDTLPHHSCRRCGRCCTSKLVPLYSKDLDRLDGFKGFYLPTTAQEREITGAECKMKMVKSRCVFLEGRRCTVYDRRPDTCRRHPFIVTGRRILVSTACPGIDWSRKGDGCLPYYKGLSSGISESLDQFIDVRTKIRSRRTRL
ncbi:MAG: YkgJ family cysteine cluster protein [Candidatus Methanosuratus sp.]|nr:YkgJ family cysteine cluster protein [Candidatus Methanosuratincola sp.]